MLSDVSMSGIVGIRKVSQLLEIGDWGRHQDMVFTMKWHTDEGAPSVCEAQFNHRPHRGRRLGLRCLFDFSLPSLL